jgi:hypothetical protein
MSTNMCDTTVKIQSVMAFSIKFTEGVHPGKKLQTLKRSAEEIYDAMCGGINKRTKKFKDQVNISEPLYRITQDLPLQFNSICGSPKHGDIYDCKFSFLERAKLFIFI